MDHGIYLKLTVCLTMEHEQLVDHNQIDFLSDICTSRLHSPIDPLLEKYNQRIVFLQ